MSRRRRGVAGGESRWFRNFFVRFKKKGEQTRTSKSKAVVEHLEQISVQIYKFARVILCCVKCKAKAVATKNWWSRQGCYTTRITDGDVKERINRPDLFGLKRLSISRHTPQIIYLGPLPSPDPTSSKRAVRLSTCSRYLAAVVPKVGFSPPMPRGTRLLSPWFRAIRAAAFPCLRRSKPVSLCQQDLANCSLHPVYISCS